jgi:CheY-like chemotaxis protein
MLLVEPAEMEFRALVVDDDPGLQRLFETLLVRGGFFVEHATNGTFAWEAIQRQSFSVILLDLVMPEVNGYEFLERVARERRELLSRIIVTTGVAQRVLDRVDTSMIWGVIRKPFDIDELLRSATLCAEGTPRPHPPGWIDGSPRLRSNGSV